MKITLTQEDLNELAKLYLEQHGIMFEGKQVSMTLVKGRVTKNKPIPNSRIIINITKPIVQTEDGQLQLDIPPPDVDDEDEDEEESSAEIEQEPVKEDTGPFLNFRIHDSSIGSLWD
jgi:hypothetical protein